MYNTFPPTIHLVAINTSRRVH